MSILNTTSESNAVGATAALYAADRSTLGYVPSHTKVLALHPEAFQAWKALQSTIVASLGPRRYELVTLAAAQGIGSAHCLLAHGYKALNFLAEEQLLRISKDYRNAELNEAEVAMMDFALKLSTNSDAMDESDSLRLRSLGFRDREIVDIALAAAARNYLSRILQALAVDVDVPPQLDENMRRALLEPLGQQAVG